MFSARTAFDRSLNVLTARRLERERQGAVLFDLTGSNPTLCGIDLPYDEIAQAIARAAHAPYEPEPFGLRSARETLASWLGARGIPAEPDQLILSASTSEAYAWLFQTLCDPGDNVLVPQPSYPLFDYLTRLQGVETRPYPLQVSDDYSLNPLELQGDERTRAVLVVSPGNPSGTFLRDEEFDALVSRCAQQGWALIVDEVFAPYGWGRARQHRVPGGCLTFFLDGLSKRAGMPQLKVAWTRVAGPEALVREALERLELVADSYLSLSGPAQRALGELLQIGERVQAEIRSRVLRNRQRLIGVRPASARWNVVPAEAGWSAVLRIPEQPGEEATCLALLEAGVVVQPGHYYDYPSGAYLVLSLLTPPEIFDAGLNTLASLI